MLPAIVFFGLVLSLWVYASIKTRRLEDWCKREIAARGGTVRGIARHFDLSRQSNTSLRKIDYVSKDGEPRRAIFEIQWNAVNLLEDKPVPGMK